MPNILLTGVCGPHGNIHFDLSGDRLTRDQDIFTTKSHFHFVALHFLAQNLSSPCVVLEHPTLEDLEKELHEGYDFVGINFTLLNIPRLFEMCSLIRRVAPTTKIVLGGYGTSCFTTIFQSNRDIRKLADHICYGEGVGFLRRILGEPIDAPIRQPVGPRGATYLPWLKPYENGSGGFVVSGLGCPNMCEFCSTSFYYGGEYIEMARAERLFEGMREIWRRQPESTTPIGIFDENLYKDRDKVTTLGRLIREDEEFGLSKMSYFSFGTIEDLSEYDVVEDLVMNGVGSIWIGVESLFSNLRKRQGRDLRDAFAELHANGISTVGSWIGGWDFHDKENIQEDLEHFVSLEPNRSQLFPLYPPPGTALYERLVSEGRLSAIPDLSLANTYFGKTSGAHFGFPDWKKNFTEDEISEIVESGNGRLYRHAGPTVMRDLRVHLDGYERCKRSRHAALRDHRSRLHRAHCVDSYPLIRVCEAFAPNARVRDKIRRIRDDYHRLLGEPTVRQQVLSSYTFLKGCIAKLSTTTKTTHVAEEPYRRFVYDRKPRAPDAMPYEKTYPHDDGTHARAARDHENEMRVVARLVEAIERGETMAGIGPEKDLFDIFQNLDHLADVARLVDRLGDDIGISKSWLHAEVARAVAKGVPEPSAVPTALPAGAR